MGTLVGISLTALLFAVFGTLRQRSGCGSDCRGDCGRCALEHGIVEADNDRE